MLESAVTENIQVEVDSQFVPEQSDRQMGRYFFSYRIRISNHRSEPIQLLSRHWIIKDGFGRVEEVKGDGVIGQQPIIQPGAVFEYQSFCPLSTANGSMHGTYQMRMGELKLVDVKIPEFFLIDPNCYN